MSKATVFVLIVALLGTAVRAQYEEECPADRATCSSRASLSLTVSGPGSCEGNASGYCSAYSNDFDNCLDRDTIYSNGECRSVDVGADAACCATAIAAAYAAAYGTVDCDGNAAYGCADASANAKSLACATAMAIVDLQVFVGDAEAVCEANIVSAINAIAEAAAAAQAGCCVRDASCSESDFEFESAVQTVLARAFATCWLYCDGMNSMVEVDGGASAEIIESGTLTIEDADDDADAGAGADEDEDEEAGAGAGATADGAAASVDASAAASASAGSSGR